MKLKKKRVLIKKILKKHKKIVLYKLKKKWNLDFKIIPLTKRPVYLKKWKKKEKNLFFIRWKRLWARTERWSKYKLLIFDRFFLKNRKTPIVNSKTIKFYNKKKQIKPFLLNKKNYLKKTNNIFFSIYNIQNRKRLKQLFLQKRIKLIYNKNNAYFIFKLKGYRLLFNSVPKNVKGSENAVFKGFKYLANISPKTWIFGHSSTYEQNNNFYNFRQKIIKIHLLWLLLKNTIFKKIILNKYNFQWFFISAYKKKIDLNFSEYKQIVIKELLFVYLLKQYLNKLNNKLANLQKLKKLRRQNFSWITSYLVNNSYFFLTKNKYIKKKFKFYKKTNKKLYTKKLTFLLNNYKRYLWETKKNKSKHRYKSNFSKVKYYWFAKNVFKYLIKQHIKSKINLFYFNSKLRVTFLFLKKRKIIWKCAKMKKIKKQKFILKYLLKIKKQKLKNKMLKKHYLKINAVAKIKKLKYNFITVFKNPVLKKYILNNTFFREFSTKIKNDNKNLKKYHWKWFKLDKKLKKLKVFRTKRKKKLMYKKIYLKYSKKTPYIILKVNNYKKKINLYKKTPIKNKHKLKKKNFFHKHLIKKYLKKKKKWWYIQFKKLPKIKKKHYNKKLRLSWDTLNNTLFKKLYKRRKSWLKKYNNRIFSKEFKNILHLHELGKIKNFTRYTHWYKICKILPKKKYKNKKLTKKNNFFFKTDKSFFILRPTETINVNQTNITQFVMQNRTYKEGLQYWERYSLKWLNYNLFKHKTVRFYFTPLRTKKLTMMKSRKYIKMYKRLVSFSPRVGTKTTIGLIGNIAGQNTLFSKKKILLKIFGELYGVKNYRTFRYIGQKYSKLYSKFYTNINKMLDFFEKRIDIIIYRAGFAININIAKMLVLRGYIQINGLQKQNPHFRVTTGDFAAVIPSSRNVMKELKQERYESLRKIYLSRMYKPAYFDNMSNYLTTIINLMLQNTEHNLLNNRFSTLKTQLLETNKWNMSFPASEIYKKQLNISINENNFLQNISSISKYKTVNWLWFGKNEKMLFEKINTAKNNIKYNRKILINKKYQNFLIKHTTLKIIHNKNEKKKNNKNFYFFKLILKDLMVQTWEKFPRNIIVNISCRYVIIFQKFTFETSNIAPAVINNVRNNLLHFRWLLKNV